MSLSGFFLSDIVLSSDKIIIVRDLNIHVGTENENLNTNLIYY